MILLIDVDGVLTDNKVYYTHIGERTKSFHSRDIRAIKELVSYGFEVYLLTQSSWPGVNEFAKRTGAIVAQEVDKMQWVINNKIMDYICVVDDAPDIQIAMNSKKCYCPADACQNLFKEVPKIKLLSTKGGDGVIAELVNILCE